MLVESADKFLSYGCPVTKDLCKQFITVASGILVFSLTMAEKFPARATAKRVFRWLLGAAWGCLLFVIIAYGIALTRISMAGYHATNGTEFSSLEQDSYGWMLVGGTTFVAGLLALIVEAFRRVSVVNSGNTSS